MSLGANFDTDMLHTRWTLLEMQDALQRHLPAPDEACARHRCLHHVIYSDEEKKRSDKEGHCLEEVLNRYLNSKDE